MYLSTLLALITSMTFLEVNRVAAMPTRKLEEVIVAALGFFEVEVDDSSSKKTFTLNRSYHGFYLPRLIWRELRNFSSGAICLVLASRWYGEEDYLRDYAEFIQYRNVFS